MGVRLEGFALAAAISASMTPGEEETAELARALAHIADVDPIGAAGLGAAIGLSGVGAMTPGNFISNAGVAGDGLQGAGMSHTLGPDLSEDFDVDVTMAVAVVGNQRVGKTSLIQRFARGVFSEGYRRTIAADFVERRMVIPAGPDGCQDEAEVNFHIWDAPGASDLRSVVQGCRARAKSYIVTFSTDDHESFEAVEGWVSAIRDACGSDVVLILVQTKQDLVGTAEARVTDVEVEALAQRLGLRLILSSARDGLGAAESFLCLGIEILLKAKRAEERFRAGESLGGLQWDHPQAGGAGAWAENSVSSAKPPVKDQGVEVPGGSLDLRP